MVFGDDRSEVDRAADLEYGFAIALDTFRQERDNFDDLVKDLVAKPVDARCYADSLQECTVASTQAFGAFVKVQVDGACGDPELFAQPIKDIWTIDDADRQIMFSGLFGGTFDETAYGAIHETIDELVGKATDIDMLVEAITAAYGSSLDADAIAFAECLQEQYEQAGRKGFKLEITPRHVSKALLGLAGVTVVLGAHSILRRRHSK